MNALRSIPTPEADSGPALPGNRSGLKILLALYSVLALAAGGLLAGCGKPRNELRLFVWSEYIDPKVVAEFEQKFACKILIDLFEDFDSMTAKLASGGSAVYDVVATGNITMPSLIQRGLVAPVRHENIPNLKHLDPRFLDAPFDPGLRHSIPAGWGAAGLFLRKSGPDPDPSWSLVFSPDRQPGPFLFAEDARVCIGAALLYRGHSPNTTNVAALAEARDLLLEAKRRSLGFEGWTGCKNRVLSRNAVMAMASNCDSARAMDEDADTHFVFPREGSIKFLLTFSVPAQAPNRDLAEKFINYLLEPDVAARLSLFSKLATPNRAAWELLPPSERTNTIIYPPEDVMRRLHYTDDLGHQNRLYDELWTRIKSN